MKKHLNIKIYGLVQGVFFRVTAMEHADKLGIKGFVRNEDDDTVYIEAEGEKTDLDKFIIWCRQGPTYAKVDKVEIKEGLIKNYSAFDTY